MKLQITDNQLQKVIKETIENETSKSIAVYLPDVSSFKFSTWEKQGLRMFMFDKSLVELTPIETYQKLPKFNSNKKSWASNHLLVLTNEDYKIFNKLTTNLKELIDLEEKKIRLWKEHTQALIYQRLNK